MRHSSNVAQEEGRQGSVETVQTNLRLRADLRKRAEHVRVERGDSLSAVVNESLAAHLPTLEAQLAEGGTSPAGLRSVAKPPAKQS